MNDPDYAETHWYPKDRSKDQNIALYQSLKKNPDGSIKTTVNTNKRKGMTQAPMGTLLDWTGKEDNGGLYFWYYELELVILNTYN